MTEQNANRAQELVEAMKRDCRRFVDDSPVSVIELENFIDQLQRRFTEVGTAFSAVVAHPKGLDMFERHLSAEDAPKDIAEVQANFQAAQIAGQAVVVEYATNVQALRPLRAFGLSTGLHDNEALMADADIATLKTRVEGLLTALEKFTA